MINLENASEAHKSLVDLLCATGEDMNSLDAAYARSPYDSTPSASNQFNHDQCHDCSYVQMITADCIAHLNSLAKQTGEASQRLLQLVELRERVI